MWGNNSNNELYFAWPYKFIQYCKSYFKNQNYIIAQLRYFDNNLAYAFFLRRVPTPHVSVLSTNSVTVQNSVTVCIIGHVTVQFRFFIVRY